MQGKENLTALNLLKFVRHCTTLLICANPLVGLPSQTSRINNKPVISTFKFGYPRLTLKEGPKVKTVHTRRFLAHDFPYVGLPSQTSRINNKPVISTFKFGHPRLTLKEGPKVKTVHTR